MKSLVLLTVIILLGCARGLAQDMPAPTTDLSKRNGDLSDMLNASDGVIRPESNIDPAMRKPAPAQGSTPIIPPPGSPGGPPGVEPK
jgi:soluble lytic murein transglycosylase-like protein